MSNQIQSLYTRSIMLKAEGKLYDAEPLARQYLQHSKNLHVEAHSEVGLALALLASILVGTNQNAEALDCYEQSLAVRENLYEGRDHAEIANCLQQIAVLLHALGRYQQVPVYFERSLEMNKRMHGEDSPAFATDLNVLGVLLMNQTRYEQAEPIMRRSLTIREKVFGDVHPIVATALNNLATLLEKQNNFKEAELLFSRALKIRESNLGPEHKHTIHSRNNLTDLVENKELELYEQNKTKRGMEKKSQVSKEKINHKVSKEPVVPVRRSRLSEQVPKAVRMNQPIRRTSIVH
mmetsp:Transcript_28841/g.48426  ORF Transcript_28841/g.48426 Transcript_28841/m.48426 type:complete len:293 (-) Transcript_28841:39-917(-)